MKCKSNHIAELNITVFVFDMNAKSINIKKIEKKMFSPIVMISTPIILIVSFTAAFFLCPEIDPVLTLSISDIPIQRSWPMSYNKGGEMAKAWEAYRFLSHLQENATTGHFTCNIKYPLLEIKSLDGLPVLTKSYFGASGNLLKVETDGSFSFSWPSYYNHEKNQVHVLSFSGVREIFTSNILNEDDQLVVDWYKSWSKDHLEWADMFVSPLDNPIDPKCIKITYFSHQVYFPADGSVGCEGLIYDTSKLVPLYDEPRIYNTAEVINQSLFEFPKDNFFPRFRLINLFKGTCYHVSNVNMWHTFAVSMVHPINNLPPQDIISVYFEGIDNYSGFNPGPISDPNDLPSSMLPRALIFIACATTLAFCTYLGYGYLC